jgi:hypothetical protein
MWTSGKGKGAKYVRDGRIIEHNPLTLTNMGSQASIDPRLVDPKAKHDILETKLNLAIHNAFHIWKATELIKGSQLIFCDTGIPKSDKFIFTVYAYIRDCLIALGIPADQIAFIHHYEGKRKDQLFQDINDGKVRILLGSTEKAGTGVNVQRRAVAGHDIDLSWTPAKQGQRHGRIERQGNLWDTVWLFQYGTAGKGNKPGFDAYKSKLVADKAAFCYQWMAGEITERCSDDIGEDSSMYLMAAAILSGNGAALEHARVAAELRKLNAQIDDLTSLAGRNRYDMQSLPERIDSKYHDLQEIKADQAAAQKIGNLNGKKFSIKLNGKTYTDQTDVGNAILAEMMILAQNETVRESKFIGSIGDFKIQVESPYRGQSNAKIVGTVSNWWTINSHYNFDGKTALGIVQSLKNRIHAIAGDRLTLETEKDIAELREQLKTAPERLKAIEAELDALTAQLEPLAAQEAELRAKLQEEVKEEGSKPKVYPSSDEPVEAPTPANYQGPHPAVIEFLQNLPEPTSADNDGNTISWIPTMKAKAAELAALEAAYQAPPAPEPEAPKAEAIAPITPTDKNALRSLTTDRSAKLPSKPKAPTADRPPAANKPLAKRPRKAAKKQPLAPVASNVVAMHTPQQAPRTAKDVQKAIRAIERHTTKQFLKLGYGEDAIAPVVQATVRAAEESLGLRIVSQDGYKYEDATLHKRKGRKQVKEVGTLQGCLL